MKMFSTTESFNSKSATAEKKISRKGKKSTLSAKPEVSENEIKAKLAAHVETSNSAKSQQKLKNSQQLGAGFLNEAPKLESATKSASVNAIDQSNLETNQEIKKDVSKESDDHLLKSDVKLNDPKAPVTQEKLKTVLSTGAFNFNPKEREALERILSDR